MGFTSTFKFLNLGMRRRVFRRQKKEPHHRWDAIRNQVDQLLRYGRLETTITRAKELQPYAEEIIRLAKRDTLETVQAVESVVRSPAARHNLFEKYVPLYVHRPFFFTRVVNTFRLRMRDAAPMAYIEFVDRPGELRPARPVGHERLAFILREMAESRAKRRQFWNHAVKIGIISKDGKVLKPGLLNRSAKEESSAGLRESLENFYVDLPPPHLRERKAKAVGRRFYP